MSTKEDAHLSKLVPGAMDFCSWYVVINYLLYPESVVKQLVHSEKSLVLRALFFKGPNTFLKPTCSLEKEEVEDWKKMNSGFIFTCRIHHPTSQGVPQLIQLPGIPSSTDHSFDWKFGPRWGDEIGHQN